MTLNKLLSVLVNRVWIVLIVPVILIVTMDSAHAQTACPNDTVRTNQIARYAYHNAERNLGGAATCTSTIAIPSDGVRVYSSWLDCANGRFIFVRESGGGQNPTSLSCENCTGKTAKTVNLAPDTSSEVIATFRFPDGGTTRYTATIARSAIDLSGRYTCSISNGVFAGDAFGGDIVAPTVTLGALTAVGDGTYTSAITLSEVAGNGTAFELADLTLTNASAVLSGSGTSFTATLTPVSDGAIGVAVAAAAFQDAAGNDSLGAAQVSASHDGTAPTVTLGALTAVGDGTYTSAITLSEAAGSATAFELADLTLTNASAVLSGSGTSFTATLTPVSDGTIGLAVAAAVFQDAAGNDSLGAAQVSASHDGTAPTVTLGALTAVGDGTYTSAITLSEAAGNGTAFESVDLTLTNANAVLSGSGTSFTATLTPVSDGTIGLAVADAAFQDAAGNDSLGAAQVSASHDGTAPTVTLGALTAVGDGTYTSAITLSEAAGNGTAFELADLTLTNASAVLSGSGTSFTATLTPVSDGAIGLAVADAAFQDAAGNDSLGAAQVSASHDGTAPTVTLGALTAVGDGTYSSAITLSEAAGNGTAFELADLSLTNANAVLSGSGTSFTATLTPVSDGAIGLAVAAAVFQDASGNDSLAAAQVSASHDGTAPTVTLGALTAVGDGTYTSAITLSEAAGNGTAFELADLTLTNASAVLSGSGTSFVASVTPVAEGTFGLAVVAAAFEDSAGNKSSAAQQVSAEYVYAPSVKISGMPESFVGRSSFEISVVFSSPVVGFEASDLLVRNGSILRFSGSGTTYLIGVSASGAGDLMVSVPAAVAHDATGQPNSASSTATAFNRTTEETSAQIASFMASRANNLVSNQADIGCLASNSCGGGQFATQVTKGQLNFDFATSRERSIWITATGSQSENGTSSDTYFLATVGMHHHVSSNALVGMMAQVDFQSTQNDASSIEGQGWMVGPYFVASLPNQPLVFDARALWGGSENTISPLGTYADTFTTERFLLQTRVAGELIFGEVTLRPFTSVAYTTDKQNAYEDGLGNQINSQTVSFLQTEMGLDFIAPLFSGSDAWVVDGGFSALHSYSRGIAGNTPAFDEMRGRVHLGLTREFEGGQFSIGGFYDGIGTQGYEAVGANVSLNLNL